MSLERTLARHFEDRRHETIDDPETVACAVLVPLLPSAAGYELVYTLRSEELPNHKGQVSFPGGKRSRADSSLVETALRECQEEIGVDTDEVTVIGRLDDLYTFADSYVISPVVGLLPEGCSFRPNPAEVSDLFTIPLGELADPANHDIESKNWDGADYDIDVITAGPHNIWGATHRITLNLIECIFAAGIEL